MNNTNNDKAVPEKPILHIAIPTYNRPTYLADQLRRLLIFRDLAVDSTAVQISVFDNCSESHLSLDKTPFENVGISFSRREKNLGLIGNYRAIVEENSFPFLWILGDDDRLLEKSFANVWAAVKEMVQKGLPISLNHAYSYETNDQDLQYGTPNSQQKTLDWHFSIRNEMKISSLIAPSEYFKTSLAKWDKLGGRRLNLALPLFISGSTFLQTQIFFRVNDPVFYCPTGNSSWSDMANNLFVVDTPEVISLLTADKLPTKMTESLYRSVYATYRTKPARMFLKGLKAGKIRLDVLKPYLHAIFYKVHAEKVLK